jgi:palmitoyl-protein thioesterase
MWKEVENFAKFVRADEKLKDGFNAVGLSQGNLIIRGYIEKYNDPKVFNFVSIHGPMLGVAGFPHCDMSWGVCDLFDKLLGDLAYLPIA